MNAKATRIWFALFVLAVFCAGLGAGMLVARPPGPLGLGPFPGPPRPAAFGPGPGRGMILGRLTQELQLTSEQRAQVEAVLAERQKRLQDFHKQVRDRFETEQRELRAALQKILTPEQQKRFDEWLASGPARFGPGPRGRMRPGPPPQPF